MKRQKNLLILGGVLVALCAFIAIVCGVEKHIDKITTVSKDIVNVDADKLTKINWTADSKTLTFVKGDNGWAQSGDDYFPVDQEKISDLLEHFAPLTASFIIEDVEDYGQYGLDSTADGDTTLQFGIYSTMDSKRYVTLGDGVVYLIDDDVAEELSTDHDDFMQTDRQHCGHRRDRVYGRLSARRDPHLHRRLRLLRCGWRQLHCTGDEQDQKFY